MDEDKNRIAIDAEASKTNTEDRVNTVFDTIHAVLAGCDVDERIAFYEALAKAATRNAKDLADDSEADEDLPWEQTYLFPH